MKSCFFQVSANASRNIETKLECARLQKFVQIFASSRAKNYYRRAYLLESFAIEEREREGERVEARPIYGSERSATKRYSTFADRSQFCALRCTKTRTHTPLSKCNSFSHDALFNINPPGQFSIVKKNIVKKRNIFFNQPHLIQSIFYL